MWSKQSWFIYALTTTVCWGIWGAFIEVSQKAGFPPTLGFIAWALAMTIPMFFALKQINWRPDKKWSKIKDGLFAGLCGAGGQLALLQAHKSGPAYLVFPIVSLYPLLTVCLSILFLKERPSVRQLFGISIALLAIILLSWKKNVDSVGIQGDWLFFAFMVFILWGIQAVFFKTANNKSKAESIFFYMTIAGLCMIPFALMMTDFSKPIYWGFRGPYLAFLIQLLNATGALTIVYAFRYGKAIVVAPMTALAPMISVLLSLMMYQVVPELALLSGIILAVFAIVLLSK